MADYDTDCIEVGYKILAVDSGVGRILSACKAVVIHYYTSPEEGLLLSV